MKLLILDNYDSFTYNLVQLIETTSDVEYEVHKNDKITLEEVDRFDKILLSPGPGVPKDSGILNDLIRMYAPTKSILGVCLGLQAIGEVFGAELINLDTVYHGVATEAKQVKPHKILENLPEVLEVGRYHSWAVNPDDFPEDLEITSIDNSGMIMSLKHKEYDVHAVQYHPESILTPKGRQILENFLK